jgi:hypothetical protein
MADATLYRIDFTITRREPGDEDFTEIGFGSTSGSTTVGAASYEMESVIQNRLWETEGDMPNAAEVPL